MKPHPVLFLTHNNLELTKRAVESARAQDIPTSIWFVDNGSTDGTQRWIKNHTCHFIFNSDNAGVSFGWNEGLGRLFGTEWFKGSEISDHVLVPNTDVVLPPWMYRTLLEYELPFVSGISVDNMDQIAEPPKYPSLSIHPDFSCYLIRKQAWITVGPFDENMKFYAGDNDWHVQAQKKGLRLFGTNTGFYHERSSTLRLAPEEERAEIEFQANRDREVFFKKWGCMPWGAGYDALFT